MMWWAPACRAPVAFRGRTIKLPIATIAERNAFHHLPLPAFLFIPWPTKRQDKKLTFFLSVFCCCFCYIPDRSTRGSSPVTSTFRVNYTPKLEWRRSRSAVVKCCANSAPSYSRRRCQWMPRGFSSSSPSTCLPFPTRNSKVCEMFDIVYLIFAFSYNKLSLYIRNFISTWVPGKIWIPIKVAKAGTVYILFISPSSLASLD